MKLKTIQESGKFTDEEIKTYSKIKDFRIKRNKALAIYGFYEYPMTLYLLFSSVFIAFIIELYLYLLFVEQGFLIIPQDIQLFRFLILTGLSIPMLSIAIFLMSTMIYYFYAYGLHKKEKIEAKYYENETKENTI